MKTQKRILDGTRIFLLIVFCLVCLGPFYVAVCYAFKSKSDFAQTKLAFPTKLYLGNFQEAFGLSNYFKSFFNSTIVAVVMVLIIVTFCSTGAYIIARKNNKFYNTVFYIFQLVILLPFQAIMFPLYKELASINALNTLWGLVLRRPA